MPPITGFYLLTALILLIDYNRLVVSSNRFIKQSKRAAVLCTPGL